MRVPEPSAGRAAPEREATALRGYRMEAIGLLADDEARRAGRGCMTSRDRRNARRRRDGWAETVAETAEGRELLRHEAEIIAGARPAARAMARANVAYRELLGTALDAYVSSVVEYGLTSTTARSFALQGAIMSTASTALLGEAFEGGTSTMSGSRSAKSPEGVTGSIQVAGFRDLAQLAAAFVTKSQVAIETAWRCEDRARLEAKERSRQEQQREYTQRIAADRAREAAEREDEEPTLEAVDVAGSVARSEESARSGDASPSAPERAADLDDDQDEEHEPEPVAPVLEEPGFCRLRGKLVPASMAGRPLPGAASGPGWVAALEAEKDAITKWETQREALRRALEDAKWRKNR